MLNFLSSNPFLTVILLFAIGGIGIALWLAKWVLSQKDGEAKMKEVSGAILTGANAYLKRQFRTITPIVVVLAVFLYFTSVDPALFLPRALDFLL